MQVRIKKAGAGEGRLVVRVDGKELKDRGWQAPALTPGGVIALPLDLAGGQRAVSVDDRLRQMLAAIVARKVLVLLDTCSAGRFSLVKGRDIDDKASIDRFQRVSGRRRSPLPPTRRWRWKAKGSMACSLSRCLVRCKARRTTATACASASQLAEYVDAQVPAITKRKWGYEQFPMMERRGSFFPLVRRAN